MDAETKLADLQQLDSTHGIVTVHNEHDNDMSRDQENKDMEAEDIAIQTALKNESETLHRRSKGIDNTDDADSIANVTISSNKLIADESVLNQPLPAPYKNKCHSKLYYYFETFLVTHPRMFALYLLYKSTWPRALVLFDMYTDGQVAFNLYQDSLRINDSVNNNNDETTLWLVLTCLFICTPFLLVWVASLRFVQKWLNENQSKYNIYIRWLLNLALFLYIFPPIGMIVMFVVEVIWVIIDIYKGFVAFIRGTGIIESNDTQYLAMKV